jgi:hypothetical protein
VPARAVAVKDGPSSVAGRDHEGSLDRVGGLTPHTPFLGQKAYSWSLAGFFRWFAQGLAVEGKTVRGVHEAVEDSIGDCRIDDHLVPVIDGELTGYNRRTAAMAIVATARGIDLEDDNDQTFFNFVQEEGARVLESAIETITEQPDYDPAALDFWDRVIDLVRESVGVPAPIATPQELTDLRIKLHGAGYHPVPIIGAHIRDGAAGKRPTMPGWQTKCITADQQTVAGWSWSQPDCTNTGILCGEIVGVDIDALDEELSAKLVALARELLGHSPLQRIGRAPKTLFVYRVETPHEKQSTAELFFGEDVEDKEAKTKVEVLAKGQQFVGFGIHPDTKAPYSWPE